MRKDISDILEFEIIEKIDTTVQVVYASPVEDRTQTIRLCNNKYLRLFGVIWFLDESEYFSVLSYNPDGSLLVALSNTGFEAFKGQTLKLKLPFYLKGTPMAVNFEWNKLSEIQGLKLPLVWLLKPIYQTFFDDSILDRKSELVIYLVCEANFADDWTDELDEKNVIPLINLADEIVNSINRNKKMFNKVLEYKALDLSKFGTEEKNGMVKNILDAKLSGVELTVTLEVREQTECNC